LRVEDALLYLDQVLHPLRHFSHAGQQVKQQFGDQPDVYNQFLDVMKEFKSQTIDTPGVIQRVSELFKGHPTLIFGFNTFLPPGYRIRPESLDLYTVPQPPPSSAANVPSTPLQARPGGPPNGNNGTATLPPLSSNGNTSSSSMSLLRPPPVSIPPSDSAQTNQPSSVKKPSSNSSKQLNQQQAQQASAQAKGLPPPVEFDHAILYVTTIKKRFADEPETYKAFLEILHTYQKEQGSIKQVLDQVSFLFRDHPDLLREFTFFLPDAVQEVAKERLNKAAEKAQLRQSKLAQQSGGSGGKTDNLPFKPSKKGVKKGDVGQVKKEPFAPALPPSIKDDKDELRRSKVQKERDRGRNKATYDLKRKHKSASDTPRRELLAMNQTLMDPSEWNMFERIKKVLPSRDSWREFLKCLELYAQEIVGRDDLLTMVKNLLGRHTDVIADFTALLQTHGEAKDHSGGEIWPFIPLAETDLSQCRRATPSYRALPASYPLPPCSFRSAMERNVCNDAWVSVPTGSEDFSFKSMRKNQYEEALFKCEDERCVDATAMCISDTNACRFEIDMVIDANAATIAILAPLAKELAVLSSDTRWNYVLDKQTLRVTHLNAISRIYGEAGTDFPADTWWHALTRTNAGHQMLELLAKHPAGAIPVILKRLQQKDEEWRRARQDLNKQWKDVNEKNYHKSLDHSSFYFKQKDKKALSAKHFLSEAKKALDKKDPAATFALPAAKIHKDAFGLLTYAAEKMAGDKEKISKIWTQFFFPFFQLDESWLKRKPVRSTVAASKAKSLLPGTEVVCDFGEGMIKAINTTNGIATVQLPIGVAYVQVDSLTIQEAADFPPNVVVSDERDSEDRYEDCCRSLMGSSSYFLFTMDKLVTLLLKQMQHMATDDACQKLAALYQSQLDAPLEKGAYFTAAKPIFDEEGEGAFWMEFSSGVLRKTPLASPSNSAAAVEKKVAQLWAPSPRTKHPEPSKWLVEPQLSVEYLGCVEGDDDQDDSNKDDDTTLSEEDESGMSEEDSSIKSKKRAREELHNDVKSPPPLPPDDTDESAQKRKKE
ncbi:hypothetical protein DYB32_005013, partial [Aphanomyces invadans]